MSKIAVVEPLVVNVSPKTNWTFVAVTTRDGTPAGASARSIAGSRCSSASVEMLSRDIVGATFEAAFDAIRYLPHSPGGLVMHAAKSAIEQALTDILAQHPGFPSTRRSAARVAMPFPRMRTSIAGSRRARPRASRRQRGAAVAAGYRNVKIAPFDGVIAEDAASTPIDALIQAGLDRVYAVRDAIGADRALMVDCHWRFDEPRAMRADARYRGGVAVLGRMSDFRASVAIWRDRATAASRTESGIRLAGGETITGADQANAMCAAGLYDVLMPDVKYAGGYRGMLAIARAVRLA